MSGNIDKLAESGKEIRNQGKTRKERAEQKKKVQVERQAKLNTSRLYFILSPGQFGFVIYLSVFLMATLFFSAEIFGFDLHSRGGGKFYYPAEDDYGIPFFVIVAGFGALSIFFFKFFMPVLAQRTFEKETNYLKGLPFKTENYSETIGKELGRVDFRIYWNKVPDETYIEDIIRGMNINRKITYRKFMSEHYELSIDLGSASHKNGYKALRLYHMFCEKMFVPLHEKYGIQKIVFY